MHVVLKFGTKIGENRGLSFCLLDIKEVVRESRHVHGKAS